MHDTSKTEEWIPALHFQLPSIKILKRGGLELSITLFRQIVLFGPPLGTEVASVMVICRNDKLPERSRANMYWENEVKSKLSCPSMTGILSLVLKKYQGILGSLEHMRKQKKAVPTYQGDGSIHSPKSKERKCPRNCWNSKM